MKTKQNSFIRASALQITFSVTLISLSAALLALATDAVHWELDPAKSVAGPQRLRLVVAKGLSYPVVIDPSWTATGSLGTARIYNTATGRPSGKVLVAGGFNNMDGYLSSAELYDAASGTWTATESMGTARSLHTATRLPDGQVLVAGGFDGINYLSSAELYDLRLTLSAARRRVDGINTVRLTWSGATSANIDVYRDRVLIVTTPDHGQYDDSTGDTGQARYKYQVCEAGTSTCSNVTKVTFPP